MEKNLNCWKVNDDLFSITNKITEKGNFAKKGKN